MVWIDRIAGCALLRLLEKNILRAFFSALHYAEPNFASQKDGSDHSPGTNKNTPAGGVALFGSGDRIRTYDLNVNSVPLYH